MRSVSTPHMKTIKIGFMNILKIFDDHHMGDQNLPHYVCEPDYVKFF